MTDNEKNLVGLCLHLKQAITYIEYFKESASVKHEFKLRANAAYAPAKRLMAFLEDVIPEEHNYDISASLDDFMRELVKELSKKSE
jgi:hypothetical protein